MNECEKCGQSWWVADPKTGECPGCRISVLELERNLLLELCEEYAKQCRCTLITCYPIPGGTGVGRIKCDICIGLEEVKGEPV